MKTENEVRLGQFVLAVERLWPLHLVALMEQMLDDLVDVECPYCHRPLELPSLEDIQDWLEENEQ